MKYSWSVGIVAMAICSWPALSYGDELDRVALRGLRALKVSIVNSGYLAESGLFTLAELRAAVESRLRAARIKIREDNEQCLSAQSCGLFSVKLTSMRALGLYTYVLEVSLGEIVQLVRTPQSEVFGETWNQGTLATVGQDKLSNVRETLNSLLDRFINDYLAANPP